MCWLMEYFWQQEVESSCRSVPVPVMLVCQCCFCSQLSEAGGEGPPFNRGTIHGYLCDQKNCSFALHRHKKANGQRTLWSHFGSSYFCSSRRCSRASTGFLCLLHLSKTWSSNAAQRLDCRTRRMVAVHSWSSPPSPTMATSEGQVSAVRAWHGTSQRCFVDLP